VQQSTGAAEAQRIQSEGDKAAIVIRAQAEAESIKIQADAKQAAAQAMKSPFAQQQALLALQVAFAEKLKATTLLVASDSSIARQLQFPMYQTQAQADVIESQPTRKHHGRGGRTSSDAGVSAGAPADSAFEDRKS
jgi:regulator of protease activity HflC (stomatin/prohibitin superfamily)